MSVKLGQALDLDPLYSGITRRRTFFLALCRGRLRLSISFLIDSPIPFPSTQKICESQPRSYLKS